MANQDGRCVTKMFGIALVCALGLTIYGGSLLVPTDPTNLNLSCVLRGTTYICRTAR